MRFGGYHSVTVIKARIKPQRKVVPFKVGDCVKYTNPVGRLYTGGITNVSVATVGKRKYYRYRVLSPKNSTWIIDHCPALQLDPVEQLVIYEIQ